MTMAAAGVAKLIEECGELQQVLGKMLAWWNTDEPHWDGSNLRERLQEEMADVYAAIEFVTMILELDATAIGARRAMKADLFCQWEAEIDNNDHGIDAHANLAHSPAVHADLRDALLAWRRSLNLVGLPGENQPADVHRLKVAVDAWRHSGEVIPT